MRIAMQNKLISFLNSWQNFGAKSYSKLEIINEKKGMK